MPQDDHIAARRLLRAFPIMCVVSFLENCGSVDSPLDLRDQFIESVGESKLAELKLELVDRSYIQMYGCLSSRLAPNNGGEDIKLELESLCSKYKSEPGELSGDKQKDLIIYHLKK